MDTARLNMIETQLSPNQITSDALLHSFSCVARETFLPSRVKTPYIDESIEIENRRYMIAPLMLAKLAHYARISQQDNILVIGGETGYGACILSPLANMIFVVEEDDTLYSKICENTKDGGYINIVPHKGPLQDGFSKEAPYDYIIIVGGTETIPSSLLQQLKPSGLLYTIFYKTPHFGQIASFSPHTPTTPMHCYEWGNAPLLPGFRKEKEFIL